MLGQNPSRLISKWKGFGWEKVGMKIFTINSLLTRVHCEWSYFWKAARPGNLWISGSTRTVQHLVAALSLSPPERSSHPWTKLPFKGLDSPEATPTSWDWIIASKGSGKYWCLLRKVWKWLIGFSVYRKPNLRGLRA